MADHVGRPQGGMKSEAGKAAYWRLQHESAIGALADLIAEHRELVESIKALSNEWERAAAAEGETYLLGDVAGVLRALIENGEARD